MGKYDVHGWGLLRKIFAISGIVQGFTWFVLATLCIILYYVKPESINYFTRVMISQYTPFVDLISFCLYDTLLDKSTTNKDHILMPVDFHVIAWIYAFLSACWLGMSIYESLALFKRKSRSHTAHNLAVVGFVIMLICVLDLVVFSLALADYLKINPFDYSLVTDYTEDPDFQADIDLQFRYKIGRKISFGVLMALAGRGFVLWLFNCVAGSVSLTISIKIFQTPPLMQYDDTIPRPKLHKKHLLSENDRWSNEELKNVYVNDTYSLEEDATSANRSWFYKPSFFAHKSSK